MQNLNLFLCIILISIVSFGKEIKVLMIDGGVPRNTNLFQSVSGTSIIPDQNSVSNHADSTFQLIITGNCYNESCLKPTCKKLKLDWCVFYDSTKKKHNEDWYYNCLQKAIDNKYDIVNMSLSGENYVQKEEQLVKQLSKKSTIVIAAGNRGVKQRDFPAIYATSISGPIIAVSAIDTSGNLMSFSNKDDLTVDFLGTSYYYNTQESYWYPVSGTSVAAALYTNFLINRRCYEAL